MIALIITYYGLILYDIQVCDLRMEINQASWDQLVWQHNGHLLWHHNGYNDIARDAHYKITMGNDIDRDIHCDVTMSNDIAMCTYHGITKHNDVAMNLFYYDFIMGSM